MRRESQTARLLLHALLMLALTLNGAGLPAARAATGPDTATHAHHQGHDGMPDSSGIGDPVGSPAPDCCDGKTCGCGCTAPQVATVQPDTALRGRANAPANSILDYAPRVSGPTGAPFRPPA